MNLFIKPLAPPFRVVKQNDIPPLPDFSPNALTVCNFIQNYHIKKWQEKNIENYYMWEMHRKEPELFKNFFIDKTD